MKRRSVTPLSSKRRGRCKLAPYTKYNKAPYQYSAAYYSWRQKVTGKAKHSEI